MKRATFKHIESELYTYYETLKEIDKLREEIMHPFEEYPDENIGAGSNSVMTISDTTQRTATQLMTHKSLNNMIEITTAIEQTYNELDKHHKKVLHLRYWSNQDLTWDGIALKTNMHRNTATTYRRNAVEKIAEYLGWN